MVGLLAALQFLTVLPPVVRRPFTPGELGRAVGFFPLIGVLLGGLLAGLAWALSLILPAGVSAALVLLTWIALTGAFHFDGLLDAADGLLGGRSPEARLRIMRDERVGAFAVAAGALILLIKYSALVATALSPFALLVAPTLGRWGMAFSLVVFPYARPEGLGQAMKGHAGWPQVVLATGSALIVAGLAGGLQGLAAVAVAAVFTWAVARFALGRLPGLTGDLYGAICLVVEAVVLVTFVADLPF